MEQEENVIVRSLNRAIDLIREVFTIPKIGALDEPFNDPEDFMLGDHPDVISNRRILKQLPERVDHVNTYPFNQGKTNRCTAYAVSMAVNIHVIKETKKFHYTVDPNAVWDKQKNIHPKTASEKNGDFVKSALRGVVKNGVVIDTNDEFPIEVKPEKFVQIDKNVETFKQILYEGHDIVTGSSVRWPFCNKTHVWNKIRNNSGHCFIITGYDDDKKCFLAMNSWGKWGEKHSGRFYVRYEDVPFLFTPYILIFPKS